MAHRQPLRARRQAPLPQAPLSCPAAPCNCVRPAPFAFALPYDCTRRRPRFHSAPPRASRSTPDKATNPQIWPPRQAGSQIGWCRSVSDGTLGRCARHMRVQGHAWPGARPGTPLSLNITQGSARPPRPALHLVMGTLSHHLATFLLILARPAQTHASCPATAARGRTSSLLSVRRAWIPGPRRRAGIGATEPFPSSPGPE